MARLTEDLNGYYGKAEQYIDCDDRAWVGEVINKLGRLEDLEEQLGCPLDVIFKVQKQNKLYYQFFNELQEWNNVKVDIRKMAIRFNWQPQLNKYACEIPLSNYKKTWWLKADKSE